MNVMKTLIACLSLVSVVWSSNGGELKTDPLEPSPIEMPDYPSGWGVSGTWVWQEQGYSLDQFRVTGFSSLIPGLPIAPPPLGANTIQSIDNEVNSYTARFDYWLLPFF